MVTQTLELRKSIFLTAVPKRAKIGQKGGQKYKITYCHAKRDLEVSKIHILDVKVVCYLKEAPRRIFLTANRLQGLTKAIEEQKIGQKGSKHKNCFLRSQMGFQSVQNAQLGSKTGFQSKQVSQKHIFDSRQTLGAIQRPKNSKIGPRGGSKIKNCIF